MVSFYCELWEVMYMCFVLVMTFQCLSGHTTLFWGPLGGGFSTVVICIASCELSFWGLAISCGERIYTNIYLSLTWQLFWTFFNAKFSDGLCQFEAEIVQRKRSSALIMKIPGWNCSGLNNCYTKRAEYNLTRNDRADLIFLCETRMSTFTELSIFYHQLGIEWFCSEEEWRRLIFGLVWYCGSCSSFCLSLLYCSGRRWFKIKR